MSCRIVRNASATHPIAWSAIGKETATDPVHVHVEPPKAHPAAEELQRAQEHISQLQQALEQRVREARQAGLREGEAAARQKAAAEIEAIREQTSRTVAELAQVRSQLFHQAEGDLLRLAMEIARRIVHRELRVEPGAVDALIRHALDKVQGQEVCRVRAHPDQAAWLRPALERLGQGQLEVKADASLEPGAMLFETSRGNLDASVETQFREIERGLADRLERQGKA